MKDFPKLKMFIRAGHEHPQELVEYLAQHWKLVALVPVFEPDVTHEDNARDLQRIARDVPLTHHQAVMLYCGSHGMMQGLLVVFALEPDRVVLVEYLRSLNRGYVLWDGRHAWLVAPQGGESSVLEPFDGTLRRIDEWADWLMPSFKTEGEFNSSSSYVQKRDHETRT